MVSEEAINRIKRLLCNQTLERGLDEMIKVIVVSDSEIVYPKELEKIIEIPNGDKIKIIIKLSKER